MDNTIQTMKVTCGKSGGAMAAAATPKHESTRGTGLLAIGAAVVALGVAGRANAATNVWTGAANNYDWTLPGNYQGGLPSAGDTVELPDGAAVELRDSASFAFANTLGGIYPASNATLTVTLEAGVTNALEVPFTCHPAVTSPYHGRLVKTGGGTLRLNSMRLDNGQSGDKCHYLDYYCRLDIQQGAVAMKQDAGSKNGHLGVVTISEGATLFPYGDPSANLSYEVCATYFAEMWGSGSIRAMTKPAGSGKRFWLHPDYDLTQSDSVFAGDIGEDLSIYANGRWQLTGTQSTCNPGIQIANGRDRGESGPRLAVAKLGKESETSSIGQGKNATVSFRGAGGYLLYTGAGEQTDRKFHVQSGGDSRYPSTIDGGDHGGLDINADVSVSYYQGKMERMVLTGADATTNMISGALTSGDRTSGGTDTGGLFFIKRGAGAWRFADAVSGRKLNVGLRENRTGFTIEEGTLQFDSLADTNRYCSLGLGTRLQEPYGGAYDASRDVDYFFRLGRTSADGTLPVLELSGLGNADWGVNVGTRKVAMAGSGRISNASNNRFRLAGVSALAGGAEETKFLYLGGTRDGGDEILDLTDGAGKLGVVKDGSGTWTLGGDVNFTGLLDVREGTLVVKRYSSRNTWFRFTATEMLQNCDDQYDVWAAAQPDQAAKYPKGQGNLFAGVELGLFDRDGNLISRGITNCWKSCNVEPGGVGYDRTGVGGIATIINTGSNSDRTLDKMFDGNMNGDNFWHTYWSNNGDCGYLTQDNPNGWTPVVFRLADGAAEVASWDLGRYYNIGGNAAYREITAAILEASPDGVNWTTVTNMTSIPMATSGIRYWSSDFSTTPSAGVSALHTGWPVQGDSGRTWTVMPNSPVRIGANATLRADISANEAAGKPVLGDITVSASGGGTIDGFAFAANGTLSIEDLPGGAGPATIPFTFANADGLSNLAGWSVRVNGAPLTKKLTLSVTESGISLNPLATMILMR